MTDDDPEQDDFQRLRAEVEADPVAHIAYLLQQVADLVDENVAQISDEEVNHQLQQVWRKIGDAFRNARVASDARRQRHLDAYANYYAMGNEGDPSDEWLQAWYASENGGGL